ncbi:MAG TPA: FAD-dependent oxidoreductase [Candidatus Binatia bacterium]|nr:FAD-dependent oxidoreductase [Candidatus Binatia bacterium]
MTADLPQHNNSDGKLGSTTNPLRVAVFGAGPAGFYAVEELLKQQEISVAVDLFDRLPTPYGLVRGGVAPDHQKIKAVIRQYEKTAARPGFRFFGNVTFGEDLSLDELLVHYHQVLLTTGAESDRRMGIPGEDLPGSYPATVFVGWYNGHPDYRDLQFDLSAERVAVVGNGNVAMDVTRILARSVDELAKTDIADYALEALRHSKIREIYLLGRRGPAQAAFTNPEIRELTELAVADLVVRPEELELDEVNREFLALHAAEQTHQRNVDILTAQIPKGEGSRPKKIRARFFVSPVEVLGKDQVEGLRLEKNRLVKDENGVFKAQGMGVYEEIPCQLVFRSIGYKGHKLPGIPFDERNGIIPNRDGRVLDPTTNAPVPRLYVAGWIKRGPSGVIGTNKPDAAATVQAMLEDAAQYPVWDGLSLDLNTIPSLLAAKQVRTVTFTDWKRIDQIEIAAGKKRGKPREKLTTIAELLATVN